MRPFCWTSLTLSTHVGEERGLIVEDTRERLLDTVEVALREDGLAQLSLRRVAARCGLSHNAPGALFGDRAGLLSAFAARGFRRLAAAARVAEDAADGGAALAAVGRAYVAFAVEQRDTFEVMFRPELLRTDDPHLLAARDAAYHNLTAAIRRCVAEGRVTPERAELVGVSAWSLVHGLATLVLCGHLERRTGPADPAVLADRVTALFVDAVVGGTR